MNYELRHTGLYWSTEVTQAMSRGDEKVRDTKTKGQDRDKIQDAHVQDRDKTEMVSSDVTLAHLKTVLKPESLRPRLHTWRRAAKSTASRCQAREFII